MQSAPYLSQPASISPFNSGNDMLLSGSGSYGGSLSLEELSIASYNGTPFLVSSPHFGQGNSPLGHLPQFDTSTSEGLSAALGQMAAMKLGDPNSFIQASQFQDPSQASMGWGGRPLQQQSPYKQQQYPQQQRRGTHGDDYNCQSPPPHMNSHYHRGNQQGNRQNGNGNRNHHRNNQNGNHHMHSHRNNGQNHQRNPNAINSPNNNNSNNNNQSYRRLWQQVTSIHRGGSLGENDRHSLIEATVEDLLEIVRHLPADASAVQAVAQGLYSLDSGALAALLKELNKAGHSRRAQEIFDWLRGLDPSHDLSALCTTMTYTTMISQCGTQQALRRALELMAEMRSRGVQCNVHTYSALMNVCIKANELDLALDVYRQMMAEGCTPNLVTYNTLIDVYGKTGAWEEAIGVLDVLESQGIEPEVRTYNTAIIACNQSSRATEALNVYERMLAAGAQPTATTYTALISAYGKAGQLDSALQIFQDMLNRGCERNVITYSSLISACEKAGRWELALKLFQEMHAEGCRPNVVTYNSLIAACAQGAQWQKAQELFEQMQAKGCRPDSVTFGGLISSYDRAGLWRRSLISFEQIRSLNCRPDTVVYNTVIGALWRTGLLWAQNRAAQIFQAACRQGHFRLTVHTVANNSSISQRNSLSLSQSGSPTSASASVAALYRMNSALTSEFGISGDLDCSSLASFSVPSVENVTTTSGGGSTSDDLVSLAATCRSPSPTTTSSPMSPPLSPAQSLGLTAAGSGATVEFGMHAFTVGSAMLCLLRWVKELRDRLPRDPARMESAQTVALVLNKGKPSREHTYPAIRAALVAALTAWKSPFILQDVPQGCRIEAPAADVTEWLSSPGAEAALNAYGGGGGNSSSSSAGSLNESPAMIARDTFFQEDSLIESRCGEAFTAVQRFESAYSTAALAAITTASLAAAMESINNSEEEEEGDDEDKTTDAAIALLTQRRRWFRATADLAAIYGFSDEVVHDAALLLDRAVAANGAKPLGISPVAAVVASLLIAARQAGEQSSRGATPLTIASAVGLDVDEAETACGTIRSLLSGDTSSISALRVLKLYLERLGADFSSGSSEDLRPAAGLALELLPEAICDAELRKLSPSTVAAAVLVAGRRLAGHSPFWPAVLSTLTGLVDTEGSSLEIAAERAFELAVNIPVA